MSGAGDRRGWVVVGLSGVTRGGKSTLALKLVSSLPTTTAYLSQDEYILPNHHPAHPAAPPPMVGINKETLASVDMTRMLGDLRRVLATPPHDLALADPCQLLDRSQVVGCALQEPRPPIRGCARDSGLPGVLVLDGHHLFGHPEVPPLCHLRYFLTLTRDQCQARGKQRKATSSFLTSPLYFDLCIWPQYEEHLAAVRGGVGGEIRMLEGATPTDSLAAMVEGELRPLLGLAGAAPESC